MQVARMLEPKQRTVFSKLKEMFRALQLEWHFSKKEILQLYLNLVPYGSNIEGTKSASFIYFGKSPQQLSIAEITTLNDYTEQTKHFSPWKKKRLHSTRTKSLVKEI
jgi:penicillin-binding protein 1C